MLCLIWDLGKMRFLFQKPMKYFNILLNIFTFLANFNTLFYVRILTIYCFYSWLAISSLISINFSINNTLI